MTNKLSNSAKKWNKTLAKDRDRKVKLETQKPKKFKWKRRDVWA